MSVSLLLLGLLLGPCWGQLLNDTYGGLPTTVQPSTQVGAWNNLKRYSMYYGTSVSANGADTSLSNVSVKSESLSSRMTMGMVGGIKFIIYMFRLIGEYLRKFGSELRVAKCLLMYSFTFQPLKSKVDSGSIIDLLTGYFGDQDARDVYSFLSRNVFAHLGLKPDD